jgi:DNA-3-methyladenine glycosylase
MGRNDVSPGDRLPPSFYARPARHVARALLGQRLVRHDCGQRLSGIIVETEAYCDSEEPDLACHGTANRGRPTARNEVMFGRAGHAYIYFTYGMHWMFNIVTGAVGEANAVLIRALEPLEGIEVMHRRRGRALAELTNGPAKLAQALGIDKSLNGAYLCDDDSVIWIEAGSALGGASVARGPRIGLGKTPEPWKSAPWRYWVKGNTWVSR